MPVMVVDGEEIYSSVLVVPRLKPSVKSGRTGRSRKKWARKRREASRPLRFLPLQPSPMHTNLCHVFLHGLVKSVEAPADPQKPKYVRHYVEPREE